MALRIATPLLASLPRVNPGFPHPSRGSSPALSHGLQSKSRRTQGRNGSLRFGPRAAGQDQDARKTSSDSADSSQETLHSAESRSSGTVNPESQPSGTSSSETRPTQGHSSDMSEQKGYPVSREPSAQKSSDRNTSSDDEKSVEDKLEEQVDSILGSLMQIAASESWGRGSAYSAMATMARIDGGSATEWPLRDEDGVPLGQSLQGRQLAETLERLASNPGVEASTLQAVRKSLLGPENASCPFVARTSGEVANFIECEVDAGTLFFGELREGCDPATASEWLSSAVRSSFPELRVALLPFPETAEDISEQYNLDPSRRCAVLLFKQYSVLQLPILRWFVGPAFLLALLQLKDVTIQDPALTAGFDSALSTALFVVAAVLPTTSAFCGQVLWSAVYNRSPPVDFLPILSPGSGISAVFSNTYAILRSRKEAVDFALASTLGSLAASLVLLRSSSCSVPQTLPLPVPSLDELGLPASVAEAASPQIPGTVLVPESILQHAVPLNQMADRLACASLPDPNNDLTVLLALPPLALAGLLGLHLTAIGLIPFAKSNGARLVEGSLDNDEGLVILSQILALVFLAVCFFTTGSPVFPIFFFSSVFASLSSSGEQLVPLRWDSISSAGTLRSLLSAVLVGGGLLLLLPKPLYEWLQAAGLEPYAESFYALFLPAL